MQGGGGCRGGRAKGHVGDGTGGGGAGSPRHGVDSTDQAKPLRAWCPAPGPASPPSLCPSPPHLTPAPPAHLREQSCVEEVPPQTTAVGGGAPLGVVVQLEGGGEEEGRRRGGGRMSHSAALGAGARAATSLSAASLPAP